MRLPWIILPFLLVTLVALSLYFLIALPLLQDPDTRSKRYKTKAGDDAHA